MARRAALAATHAAVGAVAYRAGYNRATHDQDARTNFADDAVREETMRQSLLSHLEHRAFVKLAPSRDIGVGVFAIRDIPAGVDPFAAPNAHLQGKETCINLSLEELRQRCPPAVVKHVLDFHNATSATSIGVNATSMAAMDASWYLNHADEPKHVNMEPYRATTSDGPTTQAASRDFGGYRTSKAVKAGEELLLDYTRVLPSVYAHGVLAQQQPGGAAAARDR